MTTFFDLVPSDYMEAYPISDEQLDAIARLREPRMTWADHAAMKLPLKIGRLTPKAIRVFSKNGKEGYFTANHGISDYNSETYNTIAQGLFWSLNNQVPIYAGNIDHEDVKARINPQFGIVQAQVCLDQRYFGNNNAWDIRLDLISCIASRQKPDRLLARPWHMHAPKFEHPSVVVTQESLECPERIWLGRSHAHTEVICNEWEMRRGKFQLHPLVKRLIRAEDLYVRMTNSKDLRHPYVKDEIDKLSERLRVQGHIFQADPHEIILISGYSIHRSAFPETPCVSTLSRIRLVPNFKVG